MIAQYGSSHFQLFSLETTDPKATSDRCHGGGEGRSLALKIRLDVEGLQVHPKALRIIFCAVQWSLRFCTDGFLSTAKGWGSEYGGLGINKSGGEREKGRNKGMDVTTPMS